MLGQKLDHDDGSQQRQKGGLVQRCFSKSGRQHRQQDQGFCLQKAHFAGAQLVKTGVNSSQTNARHHNEAVFLILGQVSA